MKKIYKVKTGKQLLKMFYKGKIKNQLIVEDVRGIHRIGLFIGSEHYSTGYSLSLYDLLTNNTFYIFKNTDKNYQMIVSTITKEDNEYFKLFRKVTKYEYNK